MAKKRSSRKGPITLKPLVKQIDSHIKKLKAIKAKKGTSPAHKKQLDRHIGHLRRVRTLTMDGCDAFILSLK